MTTALLIIDMQTFFAPMTTTCLPNILSLAKTFSTLQLPIILTQHGHPPSDLQPPYRNQLVRKWGVDGSIHVGSPDWELMPEIEALRSQSIGVVAKNTYDAFQNTNLEELCKAKGIERLVVVGVMTDCCVDTTGRRAFNIGFETWVVSDATGSANARQHKAGLAGFGFGFGEVLTTKEVVGRLEAEAEAK